MPEENANIREFNLDIPFDKEAVAQLRPGDAVFLSGLLFTGREGVYRQIFDNKLTPSIDIARVCPVNFHCSPAISETAPGEYRVPSVTATASFRFAKYMPEFISRFRIQAVVGKGGMHPDVYERAFKPAGAIYLTTVGYGLGATYGKSIVGVKDVLWKEELGLAQAMWILEVEKCGPFLVECDIHGTSLFERENEKVNAAFEEVYRGLPKPILKRIGEECDPEREMFADA